MNRFDQLASEWDDNPRRRIQAEKTYKAIVNKVKLGSENHVLDIGTGTGLLMIHFIENVKFITGIDNSKAMLKMLENKITNAGIKNVSLQYFDADIDRLTDNIYDLAISNLTFHHLNHPDEFLKEVYKSIKPGGKICIGDLESEDGTFHDDNTTNYVKHFGFDKENFNTWLKNAGFINTEVKTVFEIEKNDIKYPVFLAYGEK